MFYVGAFVLLYVGYDVGFHILARPRDMQPMSIAPLLVISILSLMANIGLFIWGFWGHPLYLPFVGVVVQALIGGPISRSLYNSLAAPGLSYLFSLVGLLIGAYSVYQATS